MRTEYSFTPTHGHHLPHQGCPLHHVWAGRDPSPDTDSTQQSCQVAEKQGYRLCPACSVHRQKRMMLYPDKEPSTDKGNKLFHQLEAAHICGPARRKHQPMRNRQLQVLPTLPPLLPLSPVLSAILPWKPEQFPKHPRIPTHSGTLLEMGGGQQ